jgi:cell division protein YceG involved in septum cleavage
MFKRSTILQSITGLVIMLSIIATMGIVLLLESKTLIFSMANRSQNQAEVTPFPVSVNPHTKTITDNPTVDTFFVDTLANAPNSHHSWWNQLAALFADESWYQNLASPVSRIVVIWPGERREQVSKKIGDLLHWNQAERTEFQTLVNSTEPVLNDGKYYPGQYVVHESITPAELHQQINLSYQQEVLARYSPEVAAQVSLKNALIIASLLEREASDFANMREISGVIWNRIFINMPLQLDATLQYVRGGNSNEPRWWPKVRSSDKFIDSPYNTYQHAGLPPDPIASPSAEAILAALNPVATDCLFYFHTKNDYHCSANYEEHVAKLRAIYGRGS